MNILVTGSSGFIGFHLTKRLLEENHKVICIDVIDQYYDIELKKARLAVLGIKITKKNKFYSNIFSDLIFYKVDISKKEKLKKIFMNIILMQFVILQHKQV